VDQNKACSQQRGRDVSKKEKHSKGGRHAKWIKSTYEKGVANRGETKMEIMVLGGGQPIIRWW